MGSEEDSETTLNPEVDSSEQIEELESLQAIFPELSFDAHSLSGSIDIPVTPPSPIQVIFKPENDTDKPLIYSLKHLPPLRFKFKLPRNYPLDSPPRISIQSVWLPSQSKKRLINKLLSTWREIHDLVLYSFIDTLIQEMTNDFELKSISLSSISLKDEILAYDNEANIHDFETQTFTCEICQYSKKGVNCSQLKNCGHVFCTECLISYFTACVEQGYISQVICPEPGCEQDEKVLDESQLKQLIGEELTKRYSDLKNKQTVESNPNTYMFCPRELCQALIKRNPDDLLTICSKCDFAFCAVCKRSWHGYYQYCKLQEPPRLLLKKYIEGDEATRRTIDLEWGKRNMARYVSEYESDQAFKEYLETSQTTSCPRCSAPIEKTMGCNKMTCSICHTYFCFLCGDVLERDNPYRHYGFPESPCYQKLFEGTDIDQIPDPEFLVGLVI